MAYQKIKLCLWCSPRGWLLWPYNRFFRIFFKFNDFLWYSICFRILYQFPDFCPQSDPLGAFSGLIKTNYMVHINNFKPNRSILDLEVTFDQSAFLFYVQFSSAFWHSAFRCRILTQKCSRDLWVNLRGWIGRI